MDSPCSGYGSVASCCEKDSQPSGFIIMGDHLDKLKT